MQKSGLPVKFLASEPELPPPPDLQVFRGMVGGPDGVEVAVLSHELERPTWPSNLTPAEREVGELLLAGLRRGEIAHRRDVSVHTVNNQIRALFQKLRIHSRGELARAAMPTRTLLPPT